MKKPNWYKFNNSLYCWSVSDNFMGEVIKRSNESIARCICDDQVLNRIYDSYKFNEFKWARRFVKKHRPKYKIYYEKIMR